MTEPPPRIVCEPFVMRCWQPSDAAAFKRALDASLAELQPWIPWARDEPSALEVIERRLAGYRDDFAAGRDALYGLMDEPRGEVFGGAGLYRRVGPGAIELGYWVRSDLAGRGFATIATAALVHVGFALPGIERLEIHCDRANAASNAVPRKLGFTVRREEGQTVVWERVEGPANAAGV